MIFEEFLSRLDADLRKLTATHKIAFSAACCERSLPALLIYARTNDEIDPGVLRQAVDEVWRFLQGRLSSLTVEALREACELQLPPEDDPSPLASAGANCVQMVDLLLEQCMDARSELSRDIGGWAEATIDAYLQVGPEGLEDLERIAQHPLMQQELQRQSRDLEWLKSVSELNETQIEVLRQRARSDGSNLDLQQ